MLLAGEKEPPEALSKDLTPGLGQTPFLNCECFGGFPSADVLNAKREFRERGKLKKASRIELSVRRLAASALKGDVGSAAALLKMRAHAEMVRSIADTRNHSFSVLS